MNSKEILRRRRTATIVLLATLSVALGAAACSLFRGTREPRVLVFGIDGGTWDVIEPMLQAGELPNLHKLYRSGVRGVLQSRPPVLSPVVWTTIFTGKPLQEHGVRDWKTSQSTHRKVKALWEITSAAGLLTHVFNVPGSWPPEDVSGVMLSGFPLSGSTVGGGTGIVVRLDALGQRTVPAVFRANGEEIIKHASRLEIGGWSDWFAVPIPGRQAWRGFMRVRRLDEQNFYVSPCYRVDDEFEFSRPRDAVRDVRRKIGVPYIPEGPGWSKHAERWTPEYLAEHLVHISRIQAAAATAYASDPWRLLIFIDTLVDRVSHPYWAYMRPQDYDSVDPEKARRYGEAVRDAYRETDRELGDVLAKAGSPDYVVIVSDHGFHSNKNRAMAIGTHDFDGIYLVSGPKLQGQAGERAYIEDVTPTVLYLLGRPVASDMKGRVIAEVAAQVGRSIETIASYEDGGGRGSDVPVDKKTWEQLRALGYVDGAAPRAKPKAAVPRPPAGNKQ